MGGRRPGGEYVGRNQDERRPRRPWELLPQPVVNAALRGWSAVPAPIRRILAPLGDVINPGHTATAIQLPGPSAVAGVEALRAEGFTPIEELTGFVEVAMVWPEADRRSVPETREWWLTEPLDGRLWLVRPPWPRWSLDDVLSFLWSVVDEERDHDRRMQASFEALRWPEAKAHAQLAARRAVGP